MTTDYKINVLNLPGVSYEPLKDTPVVSETFFYPLARSKSPIPGVLVDAVQFGAFNLTWEVATPLWIPRPTLLMITRTIRIMNSSSTLFRQALTI